MESRLINFSIKKTFLLLTAISCISSYSYAQSGCKYNGDYNAILAAAKSKNTKTDKHKLSESDLKSIAKYWELDCKCRKGVSSLEKAKELYREAFKYKSIEDEFLYRGVYTKKDLSSFGDLIPPFAVFTPSSCLKNSGQNNFGSSLESGVNCAPEASRVKNLDGQLGAFAGQFFVAYCQCKNGVHSKEHANQLINTMKVNYKHFNESKNAATSPLSTQPLTTCKVVEGADNSKASQQDEFKASFENYSKAIDIVKQSQERAARVAAEVKKFNSITSSDDPYKIMDEYQHNLKQMEGLGEKLQQELNQSNLEFSQQFAEDILSGNKEGAITKGVAGISKLFDDMEAKDAIQREKAALEAEKEEKLTTAANQIISANEKARDKWLESAGMTLDKIDEVFFLSKAIYHNCYADHIYNNFDPAHAEWIKSSCRNPTKTFSESKNTTLPLHQQYSDAAERKFALYKEYKIPSFLDGAVKYMSAAINERNHYAPYHLKLAEITEKYDVLISFEEFLTAYKLDPTLITAEMMDKRIQGFAKIFQLHILYMFENSNPIYHDKENPAEFGYELLKFSEGSHMLFPEDFVRKVVDRGFDQLLAIDGNTPFVYSIKCNKPSLVKIFIENKQITSKEELTHLLHESVKYDSEMVAKMLIEKGANVDENIAGKDAITFATELNAVKVLPVLLKNSKNKEQYNENAPVVNKLKAAKFIEHSNALNIEACSEIINSINDLNEKLSFVEAVLDQNKGNDYRICDVISGLPDSELFKSSKIIQSHFENVFLFNLCLGKDNVSDGFRANHILRLDFLRLNKNLFPSDLPENIMKAMNTKLKKKNSKMSSHASNLVSNCLLCIQEITLKDRLEFIISYNDSMKIEAKNSLKNNKEKVGGSNDIGFFSTGSVSDEKIYASEAERAKQQLKKFNDDNYLTLEEKVMITFDYNAIAKETGLQEVNSEKGYIQKPIDYNKETYAHLALLQNNLPVFESLAKNFDLQALVNKNGISVVDYINILIKEDERYLLYAALPELVDHFPNIDWNSPQNGILPVAIFTEAERIDLLVELTLRNLIDFNWNAKINDKYPLHALYDLEQYEKIYSLNEAGYLNINTRDVFGSTVLHQYIGSFRYKTVSDKEIFMKNPDEILVFKYFKNVDKKIKDNSGFTPWKLINSPQLNPWGHYKGTSRESEAKNIRKEWAKILK